MTSRAVRHRLARAAADGALGRNVLRATDTSTRHREEVVAERPDWEALRSRAARVRDHVLSDLATHVERFARAAEARGARVHEARDAGEARRIVEEILRETGARRILKSKSMTTEEIGLDAFLEAAGWSPLETDLGEYIVQLAGEPPSHITAPALHKSAEEIRDLFRQEGVLTSAAEPPARREDLATWLSLAAREHLRPRLLDADIGITGANFAVSETGTIVLVENEGNIRYTVSSPPVQVAIVGIEKMLPGLEDLATFLPLLTRSATGQRATTYVQMISGPVRDALHVILLDGGRSRLLQDPGDREILRCIRCGACMNVCPVYRTVGGHAYGSAYPGPIGALVTPLLRGNPGDWALPWLSSLCGACTDVCPVRIDLHGHLLRLRARDARRGRAHALERALFRAGRQIARSPGAWRVASLVGRALLPLARALRLPRAWARTRDVPRRLGASRPSPHEGKVR